MRAFSTPLVTLYTNTAREEQRILGRWRRHWGDGEVFPPRRGRGGEEGKAWRKPLSVEKVH